VSSGDVEDLPSLPPAILWSHCYVAFPQFEVAKDDEDEGALRYVARLSSGRDLVEELISYGVWPLAHDWVLGEVCPRRMPTLGDQLVRSPAFIVDLRGRNPAAFVREVEPEAVKIVGRYMPRTETLRSWDIHGSNVRLNHVFELNRLPYVGYPGGRRCRCCCPPGKKGGDDGRRRPFAGSSAERGRQKEEIRYNDCGVEGFRMFCCGFIGDLHGSRIDDVFARALGIFHANAEGYRGSPRNVPIPRATGEDMFTYRLAREMKIFTYGRNVAAVVSTVMEKDRQDAPQKRRSFARVGDPRREVKMAWASVKPAAPSTNMPPPGVPVASMSLPAVPTQE
jgi:hypothetical protein